MFIHRVANARRNAIEKQNGKTLVLWRSSTSSLRFSVPLCFYHSSGEADSSAEDSDSSAEDSANVDSVVWSTRATTAMSHDGCCSCFPPCIEKPGGVDRFFRVMQKYIDAQTEKLGDRWKPDIHYFSAVSDRFPNVVSFPCSYVFVEPRRPREFGGFPRSYVFPCCDTCDVVYRYRIDVLQRWRVDPAKNQSSLAFRAATKVGT